MNFQLEKVLPKKKDEGMLLAYGSNKHGQLGAGNTTDCKNAQLIHIKQDNIEIIMKDVTCGDDFTIALSTSNELWSTGCNECGQVCFIFFYFIL